MVVLIVGSVSSGWYGVVGSEWFCLWVVVLAVGGGGGIGRG